MATPFTKDNGVESKTKMHGSLKVIEYNKRVTKNGLTNLANVAYPQKIEFNFLSLYKLMKMETKMGYICRTIIISTESSSTISAKNIKKGNMPVCWACIVAKAKHKNVMEFIDHVRIKVPGETLFFYLSLVKQPKPGMVLITSTGEY